MRVCVAELFLTDMMAITAPKDKLAGWFKHYAEAMELNFWNEATIEGGAKYDEKSQTWSTKVVRKGHPDRDLKVKHIVMVSHREC